MTDATTAIKVLIVDDHPVVRLGLHAPAPALPSPWPHPDNAPESSACWAGYPSLDMLLLANALQLEGRYTNANRLLQDKRETYADRPEFFITLAESESDAAIYPQARKDLERATACAEASWWAAKYTSTAYSISCCGVEEVTWKCLSACAALSVCPAFRYSRASEAAMLVFIGHAAPEDLKSGCFR